MQHTICSHNNPSSLDLKLYHCEILHYLIFDRKEWVHNLNLVCLNVFLVLIQVIHFLYDPSLWSTSGLKHRLLPNQKTKNKKHQVHTFGTPRSCSESHMMRNVRQLSRLGLHGKCWQQLVLISASNWGLWGFGCPSQQESHRNFSSTFLVLLPFSSYIGS